MALNLPVPVVIGNSGGPALCIGFDVEGARLRDQPGSGGKGLRPVGDVGRRPCFLRATEIAGAAIVAGTAPLSIRTGVDRNIARPPVPTEPVEGGCHPFASLAERQGGHLASGALGIAGIAGHPGNPHHPVVLLVIGGEILVGDRPVIAHAIKAAHLEIGRPEAREMRAPQDRRNRPRHCRERA